MNKTLPSDEKSENFVLGAMFNSINDVNFAFEKLKSDDFFFPRNQSIFACMHILYSSNQPIDLLTMYTEISKVDKNIYLKDLQALQVDGMAINIEYYINILIDLSLKRKFMHLNTLTLDKCLTNEPAEDIYNNFTSLGDSLFNSKSGDSYFNIGQILKGEDDDESVPYMEWVESRQEMFAAGVSTMGGYPTSYPILDEALDGLNRGHYIIIGARPGIGKTTFILNLIHRMVCLTKTKIGFFSLEMSRKQICNKIIAISSGINQRKIDKGMVSGREFQEINTSSENYLEKPFFIDDQGGLKISQLCARAKRMKINHGIEVLFVDYLSLIQGDKGRYSSKQEEIQEVSNRLRALAKDLKIPIVCISQLNREAEKDNRRPRKSDLRESGQIEQDAHSILLLHRPSADEEYSQPGLLQICIVKNRFGEERNIDYSFNLSSGVITECEDLSKKIKEANNKENFKSFLPQD
jgi:replicative DNA helicase